ncbi:hypothetical protein PWT90_01588 [Aphanocladium album]|nr:hypothetical protein PWT90_01588 [Aphanocladium album]
MGGQLCSSAQSVVRMSKQPVEDAYLGDGELPPPYSPEPSAIPSYSPAPPSSIHPDSLFAAHLASMRCQIRDQQAARASLQDQSDTRLLALLIPHVEDMLAAVAAMDPAPRLVQTTLIPNGAVTPDWTPAETYHERRNEIHAVVKVQTQPPAKTAGDRKGPAPTTAGGRSAQEFDGWGRWGEDAGGKRASREDEELWWKDEDMAKRLAKYLQPARKVVAVDRSTVAAKVAEAKKGKSRWNILGSKSGGSGAGTPPPTVSRPPIQVEDDVSMNVTAEEVTFRRENEMGIWESTTGWGVVVRVKIRA